MNKEVAVLLQAVQAAGAAIEDLQRSGFSVSRKANNDLLTQADLLANNILHQQLTDAFPAYAWLSEESVDDARRLTASHTWIVDPIDGTKEYAAGMPEYAISVALVENGTPLLACVYNPATTELYHAIKGGGAWLGAEKIQCHRSVDDDLLLLASRSEYRRGEWDRFERTHRVQQVGSIAYKLALVAAGKADATFSLGPKNEWDVAAGVLLVTEAGGIVTDKHGGALHFNREKVSVNGIVATSAHTNAAVFAMIEDA